MSEKHKQASRDRWANVSKEERTKRMAAIARARWAKINKEDRRALALKMVKARKHA